MSRGASRREGLCFGYAPKNLDLVTDLYKGGAADITQLIDAQNQALGAALAVSNARYDFLIDALRVQRDNITVSGPLVPGGDVGRFAWSPNSSRVAYLADQEIDETTELYSSTMDGSRNDKLNAPLDPDSDADVFDFAWSPDGARILYIAVQDDPDHLGFYTSQPDGSDNQRVNGELGEKGALQMEQLDDAMMSRSRRRRLLADTCWRR